MIPKPSHLGGTQITRGLTVRDSLITAVLGAGYATERVRKVAKAKHRPASVGSDELLLEIRRLFEQEGLAPAQVVLHVAGLGHAVDISRVSNICNYTTRSHLIPTPGAKPYITKEEP